MKNPTAAIIIIGNEILSGRTLDINTQEIALRLSEKGVILLETRTIADDRGMIINTVRELSPKYDYIFTTGGIGPTHDDITSESIASAFEVPYVKRSEIYKLLEEHYNAIGEEMNPARAKMSYVPESSELLYNDATMVPGFRTENVFSLAGIPYIMKAMLKTSLEMIKEGAVVKSESLELMVGESQIADRFEELQEKYADVDMGSYPFTKDGAHGTTLVLRSSNYTSLATSFDELKKLFL